MAKVVSDDICIFVQSQANAPEFTVAFAEAATQTFDTGATTVFVNGSGLLQDTASDTPSTIMGVPAEDAHNDAVAATSLCTVNMANATNIFAANCKGTTLTDHVLTQSDIGKPMGIQRDTVNGRLFLNSSVISGSGVRVFTLGVGQNTDIGDTNGRVLFVFLPNWAQSLGTS